MTNPPPSPPPADAADPPPPSTAAETLDLILQTLIPFLLLSSLTVKSFPGRWRLLRAKLDQLQSSLSDASRSPGWPRNALFLDLLPPLLSTLRSLRSLSDRCHDPSLPGGKLLLQSDLDISASSLSLHLHDLDILLRSGLLHHHQTHPPPDATVENNAIVLSHPGPDASKEDLALFVRDLFARLQIGGIALKKKALDSLLHLLSDGGDEAAAKNSALVAREGDIACLVHLLDSSSSSSQPFIREQVAAAVSLLSTASDLSRNAVFEEGGLGPLLRLLETGSVPLKEKAAAAIEAITADPANAWAVPAYGGVTVLIEACRSSSSPTVQARAAGSLRNVSAAVGDVREAMAEEGAIPVMIELLISGGTSEEAQKNAVQCLWILASAGGDEEDGEKFRVSVVQEGGLQRLLQLFREAAGSNTELAEHVLRAIHALSASPPAARVLSSSAGFQLQLAEVIRHGNTTMQQISTSLVCNLSLGEDIKRSMAACMGPLVKMMESAKPANSQEAAARALVSLLAVKSNRKELTRDEKSVMRLVQMLDPKNDWVCKKLPVAVVLVLSGGDGGCRRRIAAAGACQHLQKLADVEVPGAKKALQRITGGRIKNIFSSISWRE